MKTVCDLCRRQSRCESTATDMCGNFRLAYLSPSQMSSWRRCQVQWLGTHGLRLNGHASSALVFGGSVHRALAYTYRCALPFGRHASIADVCDVFATEFEGAVGGTEVVWGKNEQPGPVKDEGVRCVKKYRTEVAPTIRPALVEEKFKARLAGPGITLTGWIDLADRNATVIDHKTTGRTPSQEVADRSPQMTAYALGYYVRRKRLPRSFELTAIVRTKEPKVVRLVTQRTDADLKQFSDNAGTIASQIEAAVRNGRYLPNSEHPFCNPLTCNAAGLCGEGGTAWRRL